MIRGMETPSGLGLDEVGGGIESVARALAGKLYQHPRRIRNHGIMRKKMATSDTSHLSDYQVDTPLMMHNDHAFISEGACGFWQLLHIVNGSAKAKIVNAASVAAELERVDPEAYRLLTEVPVTHALRTIHYDKNGEYTKDIGDWHEGVFEDEATHPILNMKKDAKGELFLDKVCHQEIKRGVCAIPFKKQDAFMAAYRKWIHLCESEEFVSYVEWPENSLLVLNNDWVMHGRGIPQSETERIMVWGYIQKHIADCNYRLLKQRELEAKGVDGRWSSRIPNPVLAQLVNLHHS